MKIKIKIILMCLLLLATVVKCYFPSFLFLRSKYVFWLFVLSLGFVMVISKQSTFKILRVDLLVALLTLLGVFIFFTNSDITLYNVKLWYFIGYVYAYIVFRLLVKSPKDNYIIIKTLLILLLLISFINASIAILQELNFISSPNTYFKPVGLFYSPNQLGIVISLGILSLIALSFMISLKMTIKYLFGFLFVFLLGGLFLTNSRGALLGLIVGIFYMLINSNKVKNNLNRIKTSIKISLIVLLTFFVGLGMYELYHKNPDSIYGRYFIAKITSEQILKHPFGYGINSFSKEYNLAKANYFKKNQPWVEIKNADFVYNAFNEFLELTFEMGVLWMFLLLVLLFTVLKNTTKNLTNQICISLLLLVFVFTFTNTVLILPFVVGVVVICFVLIINHNQKGYVYKAHSVLKVIYTLPLLWLTLVLIPQRIQAEYQLKKIKENPDQINLYSNCQKWVSKIDDRGKAERYTAMLFKRNDIKKTKSYLKTAFKKTGMPTVGRVLAHVNLKEGNIKKAIEIFEYNKNVEPYRYEARMDLLRVYEKYGDIKLVRATAKDIIELPVKIPSKKITTFKEDAANKILTYEKVKLEPNFRGNMNLTPQYFNSQILGMKIGYKVYLPPLDKITDTLKVLYVNDGNAYLEKGELAKKVDQWIGLGKIEPLLLIFIEPNDFSRPELERWQTREKLYFCNDNYNEFLVQELFPHIEAKYPVMHTNTGIIGMSFGGLAAAYTAIKYPKKFKNIILQSPSFYTQKQIYHWYASTPKQNFKVYISYGTGKDTERQDLPFIEILQKKDYDIEVCKVIGGDHSWSVWKSQLDDILLQCYPP